MESNNQFLLPSSYLAPICYYAFLIQKPNCEIEQYEHFVKQSIRNRCTIYDANGKLTLSVPKQRKSSSKTIMKELQISYNSPWQELHWKSINSAYRSSAYFEFYEDFFVSFYTKKEKYLFDFNLKLQKTVLKCLQIEDTSMLSNSYHKESKKIDLRKSVFRISKPTQYRQVFESNRGFIANLSIIDLLFNLGPESANYLLNLNINNVI